MKQAAFFISDYLTWQVSHVRRNQTAINQINICFSTNDKQDYCVKQSKLGHMYWHSCNTVSYNTTNSLKSTNESTYFPPFPNCFKMLNCFSMIVKNLMPSRTWSYTQVKSILVSFDRKYCSLNSVNRHVIQTCVSNSLYLTVSHLCTHLIESEKEEVTKCIRGKTISYHAVKVMQSSQATENTEVDLHSLHFLY